MRGFQQESSPWMLVAQESFMEEEVLGLDSVCESMCVKCTSAFQGGDDGMGKGTDVGI